MVKPEQTEIIGGDEMMVHGVCPITKEPWTVFCSIWGFREWVNGKLIQEALPDLTPENRELLISGISPEGWEILFGGSDA